MNNYILVANLLIAHTVIASQVPSSLTSLSDRNFSSILSLSHSPRITPHKEIHLSNDVFLLPGENRPSNSTCCKRYRHRIFMPHEDFTLSEHTEELGKTFTRNTTADISLALTYPSTNVYKQLFKDTMGHIGTAFIENVVVPALCSSLIK